MANVRVCLCLLVLFVGGKVIDAEPTFWSAWCSFFCDTDDDGSDDDDDDDYYDILDIFGCDGCSQTSSSNTPTASNPQRPVDIILPPSNGLNLSVSSAADGAVVMNLMPWAAAPAAPAAKPDATTAAPAAATTAAGSTAATTAKGTTKKA